MGLGTQENEVHARAKYNTWPKMMKLKNLRAAHHYATDVDFGRNL